MFARLRQRLSDPLPPSNQSFSRRNLRHGFLPILTSSIIVTALVGGIRSLGGLQRFELIVYDRFTQWEFTQDGGTSEENSATDPRLLIVGITQTDIENQNHWPLNDETIAELLETLQANGAAAIGLDLYRDVPHPPGSEAFKAQLQQTNVITIQGLYDFSADELIRPSVHAPPEQVGFNDIGIDPDGAARRQLLLMRNGDDFHLPLSLLLTQEYLRNLPEAIAQGKPTPNAELDADSWGFAIGDTYFPSLRKNDGGYQTIDEAGWQILLNYQGGDRIATTLTLTEVLEGQFDPALIKDRIVLIGNVAPSSKDLLETPYSSGTQTQQYGKQYVMPGVMIHAQMVSQLLRHILDGEAIFSFWNEPSEWLWAFIWALAGGSTAWVLKHPLSHGIAGVLSITGLSGITWILFTQSIWVPLVFPITAFVLTSSSLLAYKEFFHSFYDPLTGLPNREQFIKLLEQHITKQQRSKPAIGANSSTAVMFLDLDKFKDVNESIGHKNGDQLLLNVTRRLKKSLPKRSHLARLGGDEFGIVLGTVGDIEHTRTIVDNLQRSLAKPIRIQGQEIFTSASVGIALASAEKQHKAETLLRDAHTATYHAKSRGKARHEVFSSGMRTQVVERVQLESDLHQALERQELFLVYQPFVELHSRQVIGFEALVRWQHPERGLVSPGEFIPLAESTGLIIPMGRWILREACEQMKAWQAQFSTPDLLISVNLSSEQFTEPNLADQIGQIIKETEIDPTTLKLELTESMMMGDVDVAIQMLLNLKQLNIKLGLDDFGTGYSSLSYLHRFPIDTLKIDLSFVRNMTEASENAAIVKTIVELGHNLSMDVIAEGVEKPEQAAALQALSCEIGQGYFFGKPLKKEEAEQLLTQTPQWDY